MREGTNSWYRRLAPPLSDPALFPAGAQMEYSNTNTVLLGMVIEKVTGQPLAQVFRANLFEPLGMSQTSFPGSSPALPQPHLDGVTNQPDGTVRDATWITTTQRGVGTRRHTKSPPRRRRWKTVLSTLLRQAERCDRLEELEKIGPPADLHTRQYKPQFRGIGPRHALQPQGPHRFEEYGRPRRGAARMLPEDLGLQSSAVGAADHHRRWGFGDLESSGRQRAVGAHLYDVVQERNTEQDSSGAHLRDRTCYSRGQADHPVEPAADVSGGFHRRSPFHVECANMIAGLQPCW